MGDWELDIELTYDQVKLDYVVDIPVGDVVVEDVKLSFTPVGMSLEGTAPSYEVADEIASAEPVIADEKRTFERYRNISSIETAEGDLSVIEDSHLSYLVLIARISLINLHHKSSVYLVNNCLLYTSLSKSRLYLTGSISVIPVQ